MIYFFYGTNIDKAREKTHQVLDSLLAKRPNASVLHVSSDNFNEEVVREYVEGQGLFESKHVIFFDHVFENELAGEYVLGNIKKMKDSPHAVIILEGKMDKKTSTRIEKYAEKAEGFEDRGSAKKQKDFDIFSLTDALGERDKKSMWVLLQKGFLSGATPEELSGIIFWQIKTMLIAKGSRSAEDAGLKPFVFNKSRNYANNFSDEELKVLSADIISMYHDSRRGIVDFKTSLEQFSLSL